MWRGAVYRHSIPLDVARASVGRLSDARGGVAERLKAAVLKTARGRKAPRGFESHPLRQFQQFRLTRPAGGPEIRVAPRTAAVCASAFSYLD